MSKTMNRNITLFLIVLLAAFIFKLVFGLFSPPEEVKQTVTVQTAKELSVLTQNKVAPHMPGESWGKAPFREAEDSNAPSMQQAPAEKETELVD